MIKGGFVFPLTYNEYWRMVQHNPRFWYTQEDYWAEQLWDSDCNNCKHVKRIEFDRKQEQPHVFGSPAICGLHNKYIRCYHPGIHSAFTCFVHIRTGEVSPHTNTAAEQVKFRPFKGVINHERD